MNQTTACKSVLVLVGSPRRDGNSATLAGAVERGAAAAGTRASVRFADDYIRHFLDDCRRCRRSDGGCRLADRFGELFLDEFLPADGLVICSPIYWYGLSAQTKAFLDRSFCYYAAAYPRSADVQAAMQRKRLGLVLSSEETYPGAALGIMHQVQEYARYTRSELVGIARGTGNSRGEVSRDPNEPLAAAERLGRELFTRTYSDYGIESLRSPRVWSAVEAPT